MRVFRDMWKTDFAVVVWKRLMFFLSADCVRANRAT